MDCEMCGAPLGRRGRGRAPRFCSDACRMQERRGRTALRNAKSVRCTGVVISEQNNSTKSTACKGENGDLQHASLRWIEVNDVTWKLTDGVMERTPACHGKWPGFNVERGIAWAIDTGWPFKKPRWYARCGDQSYGPTKLDTARRAAMAFANGAKSFPASGIARSFIGPVNLHADPDVAAEMRIQSETAGSAA